MRPSDWPAGDKAAWAAMVAEGDVLDGTGPAHHWRTATRRSNQQHYGRWLSWLSGEGELASDQKPGDRVTPDRAERYIRHLMTYLAPKTVSSALIGLKVVMLAMADDRDWRWLKDISNRLGTWAVPSVDRRPAMLPTYEIVSIAVSELDRLRKSPLKTRLSRVAYRDTLIILLLALCPIRMKNLTSIEIGRQLISANGGFRLDFPDEETKNHRRLEIDLPETVRPFLEVYLQKIRPSFKPASACRALWVGFEGQALPQNTIYCRVILVTNRLFGHPINPHLFRSCAATTLVEQSPEQVCLAAPLLGHTTLVTTEGHYIKADQLKASRRIHDTVASLRRSVS